MQSPSASAAGLSLKTHADANPPSSARRRRFLRRFPHNLWISLNRGMSELWGKRKLRGLYQSFENPTSVARLNRRRTTDICGSFVGDQRQQEVIPLLGDVSRHSMNSPATNTLRRPPLFAEDVVLALYVALLVVLAFVLAAGGASIEHTFSDPWAVGGLAAIAIASERGSVQLSRTTESSIALLPALLAAVLFGPLAAMTVAAVSQLGDLGGPYLKWTTYTSIRAITGAATGASAVLTKSLVSNGVTGIVVATIVGAAVAELFDVTLTACTHRVR